jgi:Transposase DDE domain group 1
MADATGEAKRPLRVAFDRRLKLELHGAKITSDGGLLAYRELGDALGLTAAAASALAEGRRGRNIRHRLLGLLRQAVFGRLAGYEDLNDADRLARDPAMRAIVGREGLDRPAASTSQMGRFETEWLATEANLTALSALSGAWIDRVHARRPPDGICCVGWLKANSGPPPSDQAARPNTSWTKARWAEMSLAGTARTCPLLSIAIASTPAKVRRAVQKLPKPSIGRVRRLTRRWSCSTRLFSHRPRRCRVKRHSSPSRFISRSAPG